MRTIKLGIVVASCMAATIGTALAQDSPTSPTRGIRRYEQLVIRALPAALVTGNVMARLRLVAEPSTPPFEVAQAEFAREKAEPTVASSDRIAP